MNVEEIISNKAHIHYDVVETHRRNIETLFKELGFATSCGDKEMREITKDMRSLLKEELELLRTSSKAFDELTKNI